MFTSFPKIFAIYAPLLIALADSNYAMGVQEKYIAEGIAHCPTIVNREEWGALVPTCQYDSVKHPVKYVVVHHTASPPVCYGRQNCSAAMRSMQRFHQEDRKWCDIGYNFAVGGDGLVCEGRGWGAVGAHAPPYNSDSVGITLIGNWIKSLPNEDMLNALKALIKCGVSSGYIAKDYKLIGHRQAKTVTECPGKALQLEIQKWPHWFNDWINARSMILETKEPAVEQSSGVQEKEENIYQVIRQRRRRSFS